ncbi:MAG TPA: hypothetical protein VNF49_07180 [Candidatus Binataceae bacterium]|nr:hypothetical protein [Candidatus Binataceae bacterium]
MTHPQNVIYLPPGVVPAARPLAAGVSVPASAVPFDRQFFETLLPQAVQAFCQQVECHIPRVELYTLDGAVLFVNGISGVTDSWVAVHGSRENHDHPIQVFVPYQTIFRVEIHPESDEARRHLGFIQPLPGVVTPAVQPKQVEAPIGAAAAKPQRKPRSKAAPKK